MLALASQASGDGTIPGSDTHQFFSQALIDNLNSEADKLDKTLSARTGGVIRRRMLSPISPIERFLSIASIRSIPHELASPVATLLHRLVHIGSSSHSLLTFVTNYVATFGAASFATYAISLALCRLGSRLSRFLVKNWTGVYLGRATFGGRREPSNTHSRKRK